MGSTLTRLKRIQDFLSAEGNDVEKLSDEDAEFYDHANEHFRKEHSLVWGYPGLEISLDSGNRFSEPGMIYFLCDKSRTVLGTLPFDKEKEAVEWFKQAEVLGLAEPEYSRRQNV